MATITMIALKDGHDGIAYRAQGQTFPVEEDDIKEGGRLFGCTWFAEPGDAPPPRDPDRRPDVAGPVPAIETVGKQTGKSRG